MGGKSRGGRIGVAFVAAARACVVRRRFGWAVRNFVLGDANGNTQKQIPRFARDDRLERKATATATAKPADLEIGVPGKGKVKGNDKGNGNGEGEGEGKGKGKGKGKGDRQRRRQRREANPGSVAGVKRASILGY